LASSSTRCWGNNDYGQLGDGTTTTRLSPVAALDVVGAALLDAGTGHTCVVRRGLAIGDHLKCWGSGYYGQLGNGSRSNQAVPQMVIGIGINGADSLTAGDGHTCAVAPGSIIKCWGNNADGQVGDRSYPVAETPLEVTGLREP
jgi:alpha-tubulin suppressor-like RCC1 family protein